MVKNFFWAISLIILCTSNVFALSFNSDDSLSFIIDVDENPWIPDVSISTDKSPIWKDFGLTELNWADYSDDDDDVIITNVDSTKLEKWFFGISFITKKDDLDLTFLFKDLELNGVTSGTGVMSTSNYGDFNFNYNGLDLNFLGNDLYHLRTSNFHEANEVSPTPEPETMILYGIGLMGLAWIIRKMNYQNSH